MSYLFQYLRCTVSDSRTSEFLSNHAKNVHLKENNSVVASLNDINPSYRTIRNSSIASRLNPKNK